MRPCQLPRHGSVNGKVNGDGKVNGKAGFAPCRLPTASAVIHGPVNGNGKAGA